jgi:DNA-binding transcriptional MerR regulator
MTLKTYSIGEVAKRFNLTISTLRYYDKEGLIPNLTKNSNGLRQFSEENLDTIHLIECLKFAGMQIKDIKIFIEWCNLGDSTLELRRNMFDEVSIAIKEKQRQINETLEMLQYKQAYYGKAVIDQTEDYVKKQSRTEVLADFAKLQKHSN